jgi:predicted heme/steroid binding protein
VSLTDEQLTAYDGTDLARPIYVGLNGHIYDVSAARQTYGPGGSYAFFAGRDAARAFLTGCFRDDLTGDLRGVERMFMPVDLDVQPDDMPRGEWKIKRERDRRQAFKQVNDGIESWAKVLRGDTGRPYFWVGRIAREDDYWEKREVPPLCDAAVEARPKRKEGE